MNAVKHVKSERSRLKRLRLIIDICFSWLDSDLKEVSNRTGLSLSTLHRLQSKHLTINIRVGTLQALADAAGLDIAVVGEEVDQL